MNVELHADDLGASKGVNRNILAAWKSGALDGVSVLANGDAIHEAAAEVNGHPDRPLRIVAHLNLSEAMPIAERSDVAFLLDESGRFRFGFLGLLFRWMRSGRIQKQELATQIAREWRAQIETIADAFAPRKINALDGHIHVHMLPFTFKIAAELAKEFGITEIRISHELRHFSLKDCWRLGYVANVVKHQLLRFLAVPARRIAKAYELRSPGAVAGLLHSGRMSASAIETAIAAARRADLEWLEVICHPGRALPEEGPRWEGQKGLADFYMSSDRDFEFETLSGLRSATN